MNLTPKSEYPLNMEYDLTPLISEALYLTEQKHKVKIDLDGDVLSIGFYHPEAMAFFAETMVSLLEDFKSSNQIP
jgi:hypothetical protein